MSDTDNPTCRADLIALGRKMRRRLDTLYTLSGGSDPFMADVDYRADRAHWAADIFKRFEIKTRIHAREVHYRMISQKTPILQVNGKPYINDEDDVCFNLLCNAIKDARYLDLISTDVIVDRRNPEPTINIVNDGGDTAAEVGVNDGEIKRHPFGQYYLPPEFKPPETWLKKPKIGQGFHIEIWVEKSSANEVLRSLTHEFGGAINTATFIGEVTATACKDLVDRAIATGKPVRILYISDFDCAGRDMPISAAVKIDFWKRKSGHALDIRLEPVVLTPEQCIKYALPRTRIKETEKRAPAFEAQYGPGATELDALEALYPGALCEILRENILRFHDPDLPANVEEAVDEFADKLIDADKKVEKQFKTEIEDFRTRSNAISVVFEEKTGEAKAKYERIIALAKARYDRTLDSVEGEIMDMEDDLVLYGQRLLSDMEAQLEDAAPDPDDFDWPAPAEGEEDDDALYDSTRSYVEQLDLYREHRGDDPDVGLAADRMVTKNCRVCNGSFEAAAGKRVFCSKRCSDKFHLKSAHKRRVQRIAEERARALLQPEAR
jgi:hypothetical protein